MSEAATDGVKKKKGKLPIVIVIALVMAGGGFFMLKGMGGKKGKPAVMVSEKETDLDEFLTNTANPTSYVRAKISVSLRKDYEESRFIANVGDVRDAVIAVFNNTSPNDITDATKRLSLKKKLANAMNTALEGPPDTAKDKDLKGDSGSGDKKDDKKSVDEGGKPKKDDADKEKKNEDWDSQTGPVLKVRFSNLATQ